ncbi:CGNR zinc finger domain-containing protein [Nonomuraea sp. NPDC050556]|uniref:CGNR zinc finger domain-containing protein n=1 Tax=Nonomuraea sp. NPDC050556 TaxID=3364369 RepID=UPI003792FAEF
MSSPSELVRDFLNTADLEAEKDELSSPAELALWLRERGLAGERDRATDDDLGTALALREGIRAALGGRPAELPALPLVATPELVPVEDGVRGALAAIAVALVRADRDRLKVCASATCQWAFVDSSKNRSRAWCSMKICGNRLKTRAYRTRRQVERRAQGPITDTV